MNTSTLTPSSLNIINQYLHFQMGQAVCSVPYFNNRTRGMRGALRAFVGKGSPKDISEEVETLLLKSHVSPSILSDEALKKFLVDNDIGIDCSGFAYYILDAQSLELKKGHLRAHLSFVQRPGIIGTFRSRLKPVENTGVATFAHDDNSRTTALTQVLPGDMITMRPGAPVSTSLEHIQVTTSTAAERDHILVVHQVDYADSKPAKIYYSHAVAYPEDGVYGTGIKQGVIEITDPTQPLLSQRWTENNLTGSANRIFVRATKSDTQLRRLKWF